jgi:penicillin-insensitive murein DD-endopeptidase
VIQIEKFAEDHAANIGEFLDHDTRYRLPIATRWGNPMRRTGLTYTIALLILAPLAGSVPVGAKPALKVPVPVAAKRDAVPVPPLPEAKSETRADKERKKKGKAVAKYLFSEKKTAAALAPRAIGWYAKGCLAGGVHLPDAGSAWQTMRPSRNRAWGHPKLIKLLKRLGTEAQKYDGWPGLLVGDIAQPRGGPLITGHASHQVGLDADIWLNPMPDRVLTYREREDISAKSMLDKTSLAVDPKVFTSKQVALIKRAASYPAVERIFVHPAIKKALCKAAGKDRRWLAKVRPLWGHYYHFHIRISCPNGGCRHQAPVSGDDGCGKEVDNWLKVIAKSLKNQPKPGVKVIPDSERRMITLDQLPAECRAVLNSPGATAVAGDAKMVAPSSAKK